MDQKNIAIAGGGILLSLLASFWLFSSSPPEDTCQLGQLQSSQYKVTSKNKADLILNLDYGFSPKVKKYLPYVKSTQSEVFFRPGQKQKPDYVNTTIEFKSNKSAKSAHRYLKRKWYRKKGQHEFVRNGKTLTWVRNSYANDQCFIEAVALTKTNMGIDPSSKSEPPSKKVAKKASKKRVIASASKVKKVRKRKKRSKKKK